MYRLQLTVWDFGVKVKAWLGTLAAVRLISVTSGVVFGGCPERW